MEKNNAIEISKRQEIDICNDNEPNKLNQQWIKFFEKYNNANRGKRK